DGLAEVHAGTLGDEDEVALLGRGGDGGAEAAPPGRDEEVLGAREETEPAAPRDRLERRAGGVAEAVAVARLGVLAEEGRDELVAPHPDGAGDGVAVGRVAAPPEGLDPGVGVGVVGVDEGAVEVEEEGAEGHGGKGRKGDVGRPYAFGPPALLAAPRFFRLSVSPRGGNFHDAPHPVACRWPAPRPTRRSPRLSRGAATPSRAGSAASSSASSAGGSKGRSRTSPGSSSSAPRTRRTGTPSWGWRRRWPTGSRSTSSPSARRSGGRSGRCSARSAASPWTAAAPAASSPRPSRRSRAARRSCSASRPRARAAAPRAGRPASTTSPSPSASPSSS